jgi:membrane protease YdiL (CAAX protease family)
VTQSKKQAAQAAQVGDRQTSPTRGRASRAEAGDPVAVQVDAPEVEVDRPRYGGGALLLVFLGAQLLSSIAYFVATSTTSYDFLVPAGVGAAVGQASAQVATAQALAVSVPPPLWLTALMQLPLWLGLGAIPVWFAVKRGKGVVADLGLSFRRIDLPVGLAIGVACQLLMVPLIYFVVAKFIGVKDVSAAARELTDRASSPVSIILLFLIVGIGAPIAEEIYFRGMAQTIFGRRLRPHWAILAAAAFFAATHLQPLQFPALLAFGVVLGVLRWKFGRLGPAIWAHLGFNIVAAASLVFGLGIG